MNLSEQILSMLTDQYKTELSNYFRYAQRRIWSDFNGFGGSERYFHEQAKGEKHHAHIILHYLLDRSAMPDIQPYEYDEPVDFKDLVDLYTTALEVEQMTTEKITNIYKAADDEGDYMTVELMNKMLKIQKKEEKEAQQIVDRFKNFPPSPSRNHDIDNFVKKNFA